MAQIPQTPFNKVPVARTSLGSRLTPTHLRDCPARLTTKLILPNGAPTLLRLCVKDDRWMLARYFEGLTEITRNCYGPHTLNTVTAHQLCSALDYSVCLRFLGVAATGVIAYFLLHLGIHTSDARRYATYACPLDNELDTTLAPSVAEAWQSRGVGSLFMPHVLDVALRLGKRRVVLWGGTQSLNHRAIRFYQKFGFKKLGTFDVRRDNCVLGNFDMALTL